jgi:hypothetical protein
LLFTTTVLLIALTLIRVGSTDAVRRPD